MIAGGAGLRLGLNLIAPGQRRRIDALVDGGRRGALLCVGVLAMLVFAAFVEAFWSSIGWMPAWIKYTVARRAVGGDLRLAVARWPQPAPMPRRRLTQPSGIRRARMKIEDLTVALRPRTAWEAVELGTALARRHAAAVWKPWLLLSLPVLLLVNALGWAIDAMWLAGIADVVAEAGVRPHPVVRAVARGVRPRAVRCARRCGRNGAGAGAGCRRI